VFICESFGQIEDSGFAFRLISQLFASAIFDEGPHKRLMGRKMFKNLTRFGLILCGIFSRLTNVAFHSSLHYYDARSVEEVFAEIARDVHKVRSDRPGARKRWIASQLYCKRVPDHTLNWPRIEQNREKASLPAVHFALLNIAN
jgi:hypothetical protein